MRILGAQKNELSLWLEGYAFQLDLCHNCICFRTGYEPQRENPKKIIDEINDIMAKHKYKILQAIYKKYGGNLNMIDWCFESIDESHKTIEIYWKLKSL